MELTPGIVELLYQRKKQLRAEMSKLDAEIDSLIEGLHQMLTPEWKELLFARRVFLTVFALGKHRVPFLAGALGSAEETKQKCLDLKERLTGHMNVSIDQSGNKFELTFSLEFDW